MARQNRVSVPNGTYHVTSRVVNREHWFRDPAFKDRIVDWLHGAATFSGVQLLAWCIMDNHFHVLVHVPEVPKDYWTDPTVSPDAYAFGMRPTECRAPLWSHPDPNWDGESPRIPNPRVLARPKVGFMLSDEEMAKRLVSLYGSTKRAAAIKASWARMREEGNDAAAEADKERYCRRMYNVSQFAKTFKEKVARAVNRGMGHVGHVFEGRFHSALVQGDDAVRKFVALYVDYNPYKAHMVKSGEYYRWSSFGQAEGRGDRCQSCRAAYERLWNCPWAKVRDNILAAFAARLPEGEDVEQRILSGMLKASPAQLLKLRIPAVSHGVFIARSLSFVGEVSKLLPKNFPHAKGRLLLRLTRMVAWPPAYVA